MLFRLAFTVCLAVLASAAPQSVEKRQGRATLVTKCTVPNTAALTFDDGPYYYIYDISRMLKANNATGTFFFNGNNYGCIYDPDNVKRVKYAYDNGHQIASHTWGHKDLTKLTWDQIHDEMWRVEQAFMRITGANPAFMRPPYGNYNDLLLQASYIRKQAVVLWDFDSGDSVGQTAQQSKNSYKALADRHPSTVLALNHEVYVSTAFDVLPYAIQQLRAKGYRLVSVAECLGKPAYQSVAAPQARTADWHC